MTFLGEAWCPIYQINVMHECVTWDQHDSALDRVPPANIFFDVCLRTLQFSRQIMRNRGTALCPIATAESNLQSQTKREELPFMLCTLTPLGVQVCPDVRRWHQSLCCFSRKCFHREWCLNPDWTLASLRILKSDLSGCPSMQFNICHTPFKQNQLYRSCRDLHVVARAQGRFGRIQQKTSSETVQLDFAPFVQSFLKVCVHPVSSPLTIPDLLLLLQAAGVCRILQLYKN